MNSKTILSQSCDEIFSDLPKNMLVSGQASKSYAYIRFKMH